MSFSRCPSSSKGATGKRRGARTTYGAGTQRQQSGQTGGASTYPSGHDAHTAHLQFCVPPPPGGFARLWTPQPAARSRPATIAILVFLMGLLSWFPQHLEAELTGGRSRALSRLVPAGAITTAPGP